MNHISKKLYADPDYVLDMIPHPDRLVVGGFHQWDCVNTIAEASFRRGNKTFVDEDTTEMFFSRTSSKGKIPLEKEERSGIGTNDEITEIEQMLRKNKPWLIQV